MPSLAEATSPYQVMPDLSHDEYAALKGDIAERGVLVAVELDEHGNILDGHHRVKAWQELRAETVDLPDYPRIVRVGLSEEAKRTHARQLNYARRHLSQEARRELIREQLKDTPELSARQIAKALGADHKTVITQREALTQRGEIPHVTTTKDTLGRKQPRVRKVRAVPSIYTANEKAEKQARRDIATVGADVLADKLSSGAAKSLVDAKRQAVRERAQDASTAVETLGAKPRTGIADGQVWKLGRHTLFVGDTGSDTFKLICEPAALAFADPPYNANAAGWDNNFAWQHDYLGTFAPVTVVTPGISAIYDFARLTALPYKWSLACWITNGMTRGALGFGNWIYASVFSSESVHRNAQDFYKVTINSGESGETDHKGRKPAAFIGWLIETFSNENETVIDPFLGSGTTLLMAEELNRACIGGELSADYCGKIISRWESLTGQTAKLTNG